MINTPHLPKLITASVLSGEHVLTLLTAPSGSGKTTSCAEIASLVKGVGLSVGGILCPAVFEGGKKIGIDLLNVASGERRRLGLRTYNKGETTIGCWQMDESVLAWGNEILASSKMKRSL